MSYFSPTETILYHTRDFKLLVDYILAGDVKGRCFIVSPYLLKYLEYEQV